MRLYKGKICNEPKRGIATYRPPNCRILRYTGSAGLGQEIVSYGKTDALVNGFCSGRSNCCGESQRRGSADAPMCQWGFEWDLRARGLSGISRSQFYHERSAVPVPLSGFLFAIHVVGNVV